MPNVKWCTYFTEWDSYWYIYKKQICWWYSRRYQCDWGTAWTCQV